VNSKTKGLIAGMLGGAALLWLFLKKKRRDDEDRPAMVVKNGSIEFDHEWPLNWEEKEGGWVPNQPGAKRIRFFKVDIKGSDNGVSYIQGVVLVISLAYGLAGEEFRVIRADDEPKVTPSGRLEPDGPTLRGGHEEGYISSIKALPSGATATFPPPNGTKDETEIMIRYEYHK
jgi:hypothetical protein